MDIPCLTRSVNAVAQGPFCVDRKIYAAFVKYVIKLVGTANPITNFEFAEQYVKNNKRNKYFSGISDPTFRLCKI